MMMKTIQFLQFSFYPIFKDFVIIPFQYKSKYEIKIPFISYFFCFDYLPILKSKSHNFYRPSSFQKETVL